MLRQPTPTRSAPLEPSAACLDGCRAGDSKAIEQLYGDHCGAVERAIGRLVGRTPDLEDLVQTVFLQALQALPRFRGEASFKTWLTSIAVHVAHHHLRSGKIRRHLALESVGEDALPAPLTDQDRRLDEGRLAPRLHALLDRVTAKKRIALLLYVVEGHSVEEVASLMGASQTATRSRLFFARRELRALLKADPELSELVAALLDGNKGGES